MAGKPWEKYAAATPGKPWEKYGGSTSPKEEDPSLAQTALEGAGQGLTLGYLPQLQAKAEPLTDRLLRMAQDPFHVGDKGTPVAPWSQLTSNGPEYIKARDENIARIESERNKNPGTYLTSNIGGSIAGGIATGGVGPAAAATRLGRIAQGAVTGGILGAASNPGDEKGKLNATQAEDRTKSAWMGLAGGGLLQGAGEVVGAGANAASNYLREQAEKKAFKSLGPYARDAMKAYNKGQINSIGRTVLDEGVIGKIPRSYETIANRAENTSNEVGQQLGNHLAGMEASANNALGQYPINTPFQINRSEIPDSLRKELIVSDTTIPGTLKKNETINNLIDQFANTNETSMPITRAEQLKRDVGKQVKWDRQSNADIPLDEQVNRALYNKLKTGTENTTEDLATFLGGNQASDFRRLKKNYGNLQTASDIANKREAKEIANRFMSPSDYFTGISGAALGAASGNDWEHKLKYGAIGALSGLANKGARKYGNQVTAQTLDKLIAPAISSVGGAVSRNPIASEVPAQSLWKYINDNKKENNK